MTARQKASHVARASLLALATLVAASVPAQGLVGPAAVDWGRLTPAQRSALAPLERDWSTITPAQQQKWLEIASHQAALPPQERARQTQRMTEWSRLPPQERARARLNYQEARQLSREERQLQWENYRALPADQRRALVERAQRPAPTPPTRAMANAPAQKSNVVRAPAPAPAQPVGPIVVQRGSGATTNLVSRPPAPPLHQQAGLPKVAATPGFVDATTLLPQRGAQGAATRPAKSEDKSHKPAP